MIQGGKLPSASRHCDHTVQFYQDPEFLGRSVANFLIEGLAAGQPAMVIATDTNRRAIADYLADREFDSDELERQGRYLALDSRDVLPRFAHAGILDPSAFHSVVGGMIDDILRIAGGVQVRIYGEMVDLLWREGRHEATLDLEKYWNALAETHSFALMCAYRMDGFHQPGQRESFERVCAQHSRVLPDESYPRQDSEDLRMRTIARLQQGAGTLERQSSRDRDLEVALLQAQAQRQEALLLLGQARRVRDDLLAFAGEELSTPLKVLNMQLLGVLQAAEQGRQALSADWLRYRIGHAADDIRQMSLLLDGLADVARLATGGESLQAESGCLAEILGEIAARFGQRARMCELTLDVQPTPGRWDRGRLSRLISPLLANAAGGDAPIRTGLSAKVHVALASTPDAASISIVAERVGDSADNLEYERRALTKLQWWIADQLARAMGGQLAQGKRPGEPLRYSITLPRRAVR